MPVYSMTGFASAASGATKAMENAASSADAALVEVRSVNGRFLDLSLRLPDELRSLEPTLRELVGAALKRGKIELRVATRDGADSDVPQPDAGQLQRLAQLQQQVRQALPLARELSVTEALNWCRGAASAQPQDQAILALARQAVQGLVEARAREGARLVAILHERVGHLRGLSTQAAPVLPAVVKRQQQRFLERWHEALAQAGAGNAVNAEALAERALNEAAAYALRIDVAEELARLGAHLDEIERLLNAGGELGKRLDFLIQELHREANTLGSKSSALELTNISVEMKVAIEQMREQVQNIE